MTSSPTSKCPQRMRWAGRILALLWAAFWSWFGLASGFGEGLDPLGILLHTLVPGLLFFGFALLVWKWQRVGALLLMGLGGVIAVAYPITTNARFSLSTIIFVVLTLAVPPLAAGLLLLISARKLPLTSAA